MLIRNARDIQAKYVVMKEKKEQHLSYADMKQKSDFNHDSQQSINEVIEMAWHIMLVRLLVCRRYLIQQITLHDKQAVVFFSIYTIFIQSN